jgi:hypothetical protein
MPVIFKIFLLIFSGLKAGKNQKENFFKILPIPGLKAGAIKWSAIQVEYQLLLRLENS